MDNNSITPTIFLSKKLIVIVILILFFCTFISKLYHDIATQKIAKSISIKISGSNASQIKRAKAFRISPRSNINELEKKTLNSTSTWLTEGRFFRKVWLGLPPGLEDEIENVTIAIGNKQFFFSKHQVKNKWKKIEKAKDNVSFLLQNNWVILEMPRTVAVSYSIIPSFKSIMNWPGDFPVILYTSLFAFLLVLLLIFTVALLATVFKWTMWLIQLETYMPISILFLLVIVFIGIYLSPMIESQLYKDDLVYHAITKGYYKANGDPSLMNSIVDHIKKQLPNGRITILSAILHKSTFYFLNNIIVYKTYILTLTIVNISLFALFLKKFINDKTIILTLLLLLPMFFQFRADYHDPFVAYHGLLQILFSLLLISAFLLLSYLENDKKRFLILSGILYIMSLMIYEIAIPMIAIYLFIIYDKHGFSPKAFRIASFFLFPITLFCGYMLYLNFFVVDRVTQYSGLKLSFSFLAMVKAYAIQLFSTLPLSYFIFSNLSPSVPEIIEHFNFTHFLMISFLFCITISVLAPRYKDTSLTYDRRLTIIGLFLFLLPGLPIAATQKGQSILHPGIGYLTVYIQYFGLLLIIVNVIFLFRRFIRTNSSMLGQWHHYAFAVVYIIVVLTSLSNIASIKQANTSSHPIKILRIALDNKLLEGAEKDTILLIEDKYLYKTRQYQYLFYEYLGHFLPVRTLNDFINEMKTNRDADSITLDDKKIFVLRSPPGNLEDIYIALGKIAKIVFDDSENGTILISNCKYFTSNKNMNSKVSFKGQSSDALRTLDTVLNYRGPYYSLSSVSFNDQLANFHSLRFF
jgi:hypothetical protein